MPNLPRFTPGANQDNTLRNATQDYLNPAYAASIALKPVQGYTLVNFQLLTGALGLTADVTQPYIGDELELLFAPDATNRVVTFGTGFASAGTLTVVASKFGSAKFIFNGTVWVERSRALTA